MSTTTEVIVCAGGCGRSTTDLDLWDPCAETGKSYCDECFPSRTRTLEPVEFRVTEVDGRFEVHIRSGYSRHWSLFDRFNDAEAIGEAVGEEITYQRKIAPS